ncbi:MAG: EFR1 family ferrodoxin, partial [Bacteroidales bacterium]|nr:EFR1 family ferrodoxin [Bacteroidales bacterium]
MIFYFSGTGNSQHVATRLGELLGDTNIKNIAEYYDDVVKGNNFAIDVEDHSKPLGFVCPVHSWGIAKSMKRFLQKTKINYQGNKIFAILVCGDNCGKAREQLQEALWKRSHLRCNMACSVQMPNTYIVMKGFGTDPDELAAQKLAAAEKQLPEIADAITNDKPYDHYV